MDISDIEKGPNTSPLRPTITQREISSASSTSPPLPLSPPSKRTLPPLEIFQTLVGIEFLAPGGGLTRDEDRKIPAPKHPLRSVFLPSANHARNRGLYERAVNNDWHNAVLYKCSSYIISGLYLLQILLAATFTALSAYHQHGNGSSVSLTTLGAINTVVAGVLAWLKGQGMPNRFRTARDNFREVVREIEMCERMFAEVEFCDWGEGGRGAPDPVMERDRVERMFEGVVREMQMNYPDEAVSLRKTEGGGKGVAEEDLRGKIRELEGKLAGKEREGARVVEEVKGVA